MGPLGSHETRPAVSQGIQGWRIKLGGDQMQIASYTEVDWGSDCDDRRSIGAYVIKIGCGAVSWK